MQCDEIQERLVELLYDEKGTPAAGPQLREHVRSCPACQKALAELKAVQSTLKVWEDEPPLRPVTIPAARRAQTRFQFTWWGMVKYGAIAAVVAMAFLGLFNAQVTWDRNGFSFRTSLKAPASDISDSYKKEFQAMIQRVMEDSREFNLQMAQMVLETIDQQRVADYRTLARQIKGSQGKYAPDQHGAFGPLEGEDK